MKTEPFSISPAEVKRAWRVVSWAGLLGSIYYLICITGAPRIKYLTELKASPFDFGLIAGFGSFALIFQVVGSMISNRIASRKPVWMVLTITHRVIFAGALVAPMLFHSQRLCIWWIIFVFAMHDVFANLGSPLWFAWMADLVPSHTMNRHWASRQKFITFLTMIAMVALAFGFDWFEKTNQVVLGFTIVAAVGILLGVMDISLFTFVPEPPNEVVRQESWIEAVAQPLRDKKFRRYLVFVSFWQFSIFLASPFFGPFMIEDLHMNVLTVQMINVAHSVGVVISSGFWGLLCDTYGFRRVLQILAVAKITAPLYFVFAPPIPGLGVPYLALMFFLDGILNSGMTLATQGVLLKSTPRANRAMYIATSNFISLGIMAGVASIVAGKAIDSLNHVFSYDIGMYHLTGYHLVFFASIFVRCGAIPLASRIHETRQVALGTVLRQMFSRDSYRVARLVHQLHESPQEKRRLQAVHLLRDLGHPMAIGELIHALEDPSREVREAATDALGWFGVGEAAEPLAKALKDPDPAVQARAARALGRIGGEESLLALLENLRDENTHALHETVDALGHIGDNAALVPLLFLFYEFDNPHLRRRIAIALSKIDHEESADEVMTLLASEAEQTAAKSQEG